jgi:hypothetical protein
MIQLDASDLHLHAGKLPAGLVIYWAWNNCFGTAAERHHAQACAKIELFDNIKALFVKKRRRSKAADIHSRRGRACPGHPVFSVREVDAAQARA